MLIKVKDFDEEKATLVYGIDGRDFLKRKKKLIPFSTSNVGIFYYTKSGSLVFHVIDGEVYDYELNKHHIFASDDIKDFLEPPAKGGNVVSIYSILMSQEKIVDYQKRIAKNINEFFTFKNRYVIPFYDGYTAINQNGLPIYSVEEGEEDGFLNVVDWPNLLYFETPIEGTPFEKFEKIISPEKEKLRQFHDEKVLKKLIL